MRLICTTGMPRLHAALWTGDEATALSMIGRLDMAELTKRDEFGWQPLHRAAAQGSRAMTLALLSRGVPLDGPAGPFAATALHLAAANGHLCVVRLLVRAGADPSACGSRHQAPPYASADEAGHHDLARELKANCEAKIRERDLFPSATSESHAAAA